MQTPSQPSSPTSVSLADIEANAIRLLEAAEAETDRGLMDLYRCIADSWVGLGHFLLERHDLD